MTTLQPRSPYTREELSKLYPKGLQLQQVQVLLRHGERTPVSARFQGAGLAPFWPYCAVARRLTSMAMTNLDASAWSNMQWRRQLETFGENDEPVIVTVPGADVDTVCNLGELTDKGRQTTLALGQRLRHLYVDQLGFMPKSIDNTHMFYLRTTLIPRALESMQQTFWGMYPSSARSKDLLPTIVTRTAADETLFPNDSSCRRFSQLSRAFAQRTADRWNHTSEMEYLNRLISKWMPEHSKRVAVDSHPRLSGIMDTINSTLAHGPSTRLPEEFYDARGREIIDRIGTEEWFSGYQESSEYRALGIGALLGDVVSRMVGNAGLNKPSSLGSDTVNNPARSSGSELRFALMGCHDTTLAAILASLGAFEGEKWPPYTSHIAFELFRKSDGWSDMIVVLDSGTRPSTADSNQAIQQKATWTDLFGSILGNSQTKELRSEVDTRKKIEDLESEKRGKLDNYYIRMRYNDRPMTIPGCQLDGKHLEGDETFCTLAAFKQIVDQFTPPFWKQACLENLDKPSLPPTVEPAGV